MLVNILPSVFRQPQLRTSFSLECLNVNSIIYPNKKMLQVVAGRNISDDFQYCNNKFNDSQNILWPIDGSQFNQLCLGFGLVLISVDRQIGFRKFVAPQTQYVFANTSNSKKLDSSFFESTKPAFRNLLTFITVQPRLTCRSTF